jgi:hypothetical protein
MGKHAVLYFSTLKCADSRDRSLVGSPPILLLNASVPQVQLAEQSDNLVIPPLSVESINNVVDEDLEESSHPSADFEVSDGKEDFHSPLDLQSYAQKHHEFEFNKRRGSFFMNSEEQK